MIQATIETEIAPIVGTQEQAEDLIRYIRANSRESQGEMWNTLIFGKSVGQLVEEGIQTKVARMTDESQTKFRKPYRRSLTTAMAALFLLLYRAFMGLFAFCG